LDFPLPVTNLLRTVISITLVVDSVGVAVGSLFSKSVELKITTVRCLCIDCKLFLLLPVLSRHNGHLVCARFVLFSSSCSPVIFGKTQQSVSVNS